MHGLDGLWDASEALVPLADEVLERQVSPQELVHEARHAVATLDATEGGADPLAPGDELEGPPGSL